MNDPNGKLFVYTLGIPDRALSPNGDGVFANKMKRARLRKEYKRRAVVAAIIQGRPKTPFSEFYLQPVFYHKTRRRRDRDGLLTSLKSGIDGLVLAGVAIDDVDMIPEPAIRLKDKHNPRVDI